MGGFYTNYTVYSTDQLTVANLLRQNLCKAYVCPPDAGCILVVDSASDSQREKEVCAVGSILSKELGRSVLAVMNHDDDVLYYSLFQSGQITDEYDSLPDYFSSPGPIQIPTLGDTNIVDREKLNTILASWKPADPRGGNAKMLCEAYECSTSAEKVEAILRRNSREYAFASNRHQDLANVLGITKLAIGTAYASFASHDLPEGLKEADCIQVG